MYHLQLCIWKITVHVFKDTLPGAEVSYIWFIFILAPHAHLTGSFPVRSCLNRVIIEKEDITVIKMLILGSSTMHWQYRPL